MALLATWGQYSTYVDAQGKYRVIWQGEDGTIRMHKFDTVKTLVELERFFADFENWDGATQLVQPDDEDLIKDVVVYIRTHPALTLTQWNTLLGTHPWQDAAQARYFLYKLAIKLAEHYGVILDDFTEGQILLKVRNWIVNAPIRTLKRVVFGYNINI